MHVLPTVIVLLADLAQPPDKLIAGIIGHLSQATSHLLLSQVRLRVRGNCRQVCRENEVDILRGVLSSDHVHMFVSVPPKLTISDLLRKMKGRSSHRVQREFLQLRRRY